MITADIVAKHILSLSNPDFHDTISNLKLQKTLYYCQGFTLALTNIPLFSDVIVAWKHGPVVISVYEKYKHYKDRPISKPKKLKNVSSLGEGEKSFIELIYNDCARHSTWKLRDRTHENAPWRLIGYNQEIDQNLLRSYFKRQIKYVEPSLTDSLMNKDYNVSSEFTVERDAFNAAASFARGFGHLFAGAGKLVDLGNTLSVAQHTELNTATDIQVLSKQ